jgi:hypothetical protein
MRDPNEHLDAMRRENNALDRAETPDEIATHAAMLSLMFEELDTWLSNPSSYLPQEWAKGLDKPVLVCRKLAEIDLSPNEMDPIALHAWIGRMQALHAQAREALSQS